MEKQTALEFYRSNLMALVSTGKTDFKTEPEIFEQAKEMHKQEIYQHAINFNLFVENDEVTDQKVEIIENLYKDYLEQFYN